MKALWFLAGIPARYAVGNQPERGLLACPLASTRLRTAIASLAWRERGNENMFSVPAVTGDPWTSGAQDARICIVPKFYVDSPLETWLAACRAAKRNLCRLVIDISDYPFEKPPPVPAFYAEVLQMCDVVVVNSEHMARMMARHTPQRVMVVEDAILGDPGRAEFAPGERLEILWFGHPSNLDFLEAQFDGLAQFARQRRCRLTLVTSGGPEAAQWTQKIPDRFGRAFETQFIPWSQEAMPVAFRHCDVVLIPSDPANPFKAGASANRVAEALSAGRFPVASALQSYQQFADASWLGEDLCAGIHWALANPDEVLTRIRRGQVLVSEKFAAARIGRQWCELFEKLARAGSS